MATGQATGDIWDFVEDSLKTEVPAYFKTVLMACGYNNGISISAIGEEDLDYIQLEVRNGNVGKVFDGSAVDYLDGCSKSAEKFEFVLGHKKFLKAIVEFLKKHKSENGLASFSLIKKKKAQATVPKSTKMKEQKVGPQSKRKLKRHGRKMDPRILPLVEFAMNTELEPQRKAPTISAEILAKHREDLLIKTVSAIMKFTPDLYEEKIEEVKGKLSTNFITFELDKQQELLAEIGCVFCEKHVTGYHKPSPNNPYLWKAPNFNRHLRFIHKHKDDSQESDSDSDAESNIHDERKQKSDNLDENGALETGDDKEVDKKPTASTSDRNNILLKKVEVAVEDGEQKQAANGLEMSENDLTKIKIPTVDGEGETMTEIDERKATLSVAVIEPNHPQSHGGNTYTLSKEEGSVSDSKLMEIPMILKNGGKSRNGNNFIVTKRTCAFDTVINAYAFIYSENSNYRNQLGNSRSSLTEFIKSLFKRAESTSLLPNDYHTQMLTSRNAILLELYEGWCNTVNFVRNQETTFIDCKTGIGALFARMCKFEKNFFSSFESKNCKKCGNAFTKLLPFLKTTGKIRNMGKINEYLDRGSQQRLCARCKNECEVTTLFNSIVVLETEPTSVHQNGRVTTLGMISSQLNIEETPYMLCAVMHYDTKLEHFVAYTSQTGDAWNCLDDLKKTGQIVDAATEVHPFVLCYASKKRSIHFENSIHDKKLVQKAANSLSLKKRESQDVPTCVPEIAATPALAASQSDELSKKKRKKKPNMGKNQKKNKSQ